MQALRLAMMAGALAISHAAQGAVNVELAAGVNGNWKSNLLLVGLTREAGTFLGLPTYQELNIGGWGGGEYVSSVAGIAQGLRIPFGATLFEVSTGGSYVSETSRRLSTEFEFYEQFVLRRDIAGTNLALSYRHWSNAGIRYPNRGMDFIGFGLSHSW